MNTFEVGTQLVQLCREGKNDRAIDTLYAKDITSVEAFAPNGDREAHGIDAIKAKGKWWMENHTVHSAVIEGPFPLDDKFAVFFKYDVTQKMSGNRFNMEEVGIYYVKNGKIVREEFCYKGM
jgi:hypothetical protein